MTRLAVCSMKENRVTVYEGKVKKCEAKFTRMLEPAELREFWKDPEGFMKGIGYEEDESAEQISQG